MFTWRWHLSRLLCAMTCSIWGFPMYTDKIVLTSKTSRTGVICYHSLLVLLQLYSEMLHYLLIEKQKLQTDPTAYWCVMSSSGKYRGALSHYPILVSLSEASVDVFWHPKSKLALGCLPQKWKECCYVVTWLYAWLTQSVSLLATLLFYWWVVCRNYIYHICFCFPCELKILNHIITHLTWKRLSTLSGVRKHGL